MLRTLYAKLALALVLTFLLMGWLLGAIMTYSMDMYQQEVCQKLYRDVAAYVVEHNELTLDTASAQAAVNELFESLMIINPTVEVYLLDPKGDILAYSAAPGVVRRQRVDTGPIRAFMGGAELPLFGQDPRNPEGEKIFSAAPIHRQGQLAGYLYVITGSERHDSIASMLRGSYILRLSIAGAVSTALFAVLAGLLVFALLTRRLRRLSSAVASFERDARVDLSALPESAHASGDEIDRLSATFRRMAERIASRIGDLEQADRLRRELVANVSHDLRTPLASLQGFLDTVLMKHDELSSEERREYLEIAARHSHRLGDLIGELFELAYLDAKDQPPEREPFSLEDLAQDVLQEFALKTREAGITMRVDAPPGLPLVYGNIGMIERVLENLIRNAVRYTPRGGQVTLALAAHAKGVTVRLSDTGCGIAAEDMPYIFDRFYQPHKERSASDGVGLGLAIARRILELHGSHIEAISEVSKGTTFTFDLPAALRANLSPGPLAGATSTASLA
ncbi:MAG: HAMP domain-containing histidine kinase [Gammaproteobacteria bacterium]|nr:HAMP domain-containing histidine kinase [Gammaproteobacteria bacterium]